MQRASEIGSEAPPIFAFVAPGDVTCPPLQQLTILNYLSSSD
jgi:hypothetical protein